MPTMIFPTSGSPTLNSSTEAAAAAAMILPPPTDSPSILTKHTLVFPGKKRRRMEDGGMAGYPAKKVQFSTMCTVHEFQVDPEMKERCWIPKRQLDHARSRAKALSAQICKNAHMKDHCLSYQNVLEDVYAHALKGKAPPDSQGLFVWIQHGHTRRGLERWSVPTVGWHRQGQRGILYQKLRLLQQQPNLMNKEYVLRQLSRHYSKSSRVYAQVLGAADANAVAAELCSEPEHLF